MSPAYPSSPADVQRAQRALERLHAETVSRYGVAVLDVRVVEGGAVLRLEGDVLLPSQRAAALARVGDAVGAMPEDGMRVLVEATRHGGWFSPRGDVVNVLAAPDGALATQLVDGDPPLRQLATRGAWWAAQLADDTVGWVEGDAMAAVSPQDAPAGVPAWRAAWRGGLRRPPRDEDWRAAIQPWYGTPYLWGGTTPAGVDCSGLVQRLYREVAGLGLPKNSADQIRAGARISAQALERGDLVYLTRVGTAVRHIALVVDEAPLIVVHAGIDAGVAVEALSDLLQRYTLRGAARIPFGDAHEDSAA